MKSFKLAIGLLAGLYGAASHATVLDFISLADGPVYGESGYTTLTLGTASITGTYAGDPAFAYLDRRIAGLGVCKSVAVTGPQGNSGINQCAVSSDDNVSFDEALQFVFTQNVVITNIWFNNNHDGGFGAGDMLTIEGVDYAAVTGYAGDANAYSTWAISAGDSFDVSFDNEQFYVSAIEWRVPEPGMLALLSLGLIGVGLAKRKRS